MLSVNLEGVGCAGNLTHQVDDPNLANIREGIRLLLQSATQNGTCTIKAAQAEWYKSQVYNELDLNLAIGANVKYSAGHLDSMFKWTDTTKKTKIIAKYQQMLYEVNVNTPVTQADFFDPARTNTDQINAAMPAGSDPMYVAGVKYGMMALMFFEFAYSAKDLDTAIDIAYNGGVITGTITGTVTAKQIFDDFHRQYPGLWR